jgi:hypothetical protein
MKVFLLSPFVLCFMLIATRDTAAQTAIPASFYPAGEIRAILAQPGCRGIRVYPVFDAERETNSTMLIGIDADGREIQNDTAAASRYMLFTGVNEDMPTNRTLSRDDARTACSAFNAGNAPFVADLNAGLLAACLGEESLGVVLSHSSSNGQNFQARGFRRENGLQGFGAANPGDPCPTNCGSRDQYLCSPN